MFPFHITKPIDELSIILSSGYIQHTWIPTMKSHSPFPISPCVKSTKVLLQAFQRRSRIAFIGAEEVSGFLQLVL